jgi:hypothetical protein
VDFVVLAPIRHCCDVSSWHGGAQLVRGAWVAPERGLRFYNTRHGTALFGDPLVSIVTPVRLLVRLGNDNCDNIDSIETTRGTTTSSGP